VFFFESTNPLSWTVSLAFGSTKHSVTSDRRNCFFHIPVYSWKLKYVSMCFSFFCSFQCKKISFIYICLSCRFHFSNATTKHFFLSLSSSNSYSIDKHSHLSRIHFSHQSCLWVQEAVQSVFVVSQCVAFAERCLSVSPYSEQMFLCIQLE